MLRCLSAVMAKQEIESDTAGSLYHVSLSVGVLQFWFLAAGAAAVGAFACYVASAATLTDSKVPCSS